MRRLVLPQSWQTRALVITDVAEPEAWFNDEELTLARLQRLPRRRRDWMLSRIAAKELARERGGDWSNAALIQQSAELSFSHSHGFGAAAMGHGPVGIDVEKLRSIDLRAAHLFLTPAEETVMRSCAIDNPLLHFWCAKEAAWKQLGGSILTLKQVPLRLLDATRMGLRFDRVETWSTDEVIVALTN